ncbi:MAG: hypothetical protein ABJO27_24215 [Pseudoruegeria sp.]
MAARIVVFSEPGQEVLDLRACLSAAGHDIIRLDFGSLSSDFLCDVSADICLIVLSRPERLSKIGRHMRIGNPDSTPWIALGTGMGDLRLLALQAGAEDGLSIQIAPRYLLGRINNILDQVKIRKVPLAVSGFQEAAQTFASRPHVTLLTQSVVDPQADWVLNLSHTAHVTACKSVDDARSDQLLVIGNAGLPATFLTSSYDKTTKVAPFVMFAEHPACMMGIAALQDGALDVIGTNQETAEQEFRIRRAAFRAQQYIRNENCKTSPETVQNQYRLA